MDFVKTSIKRPIAIIMSMLIVLLLGFVAASKMELALMPEMELPYAIIMTQYTDAGPEEVENLVTIPIENAISNVENVKKIMSSSSEGFSVVQIEFSYGTDMNIAVSDLRDRVSMIEDFLPDDTGKSNIMKIEMDAMPIAFFVVSSENMDAYELKTFAEENIKNRLERQKGVASVDISGGLEREIRVEVDEDKVQGYGLDNQTIAQILRAENVNQSGGSVEYGEKSFAISTKLRMKSIEDVKRTPIPLPSGVILQLQDIARITESSKKVNSISRYNSTPCVLLSATKASDGNTVSAVEAMEKEVLRLQKDYPEVSIRIVVESATIIKDSIRNVMGNILIATVLSILILLIFLKNVGLTGVIAISMPLSIIGTFVMLYFSGTTINIVSLGGLSIGVGMLVDNSIVVLENIYRYRTKLEYDKIRGTYLGTKEVLSSIVASTLTTIVVFLPFVFAEGIVIQMMRDLALAVVFSLTMSLLAAMTVVPMLAGNYVNNVHRNRSKKYFRFINPLMDLFDKSIKRLTKRYETLLAWSLTRKKRVLALSLLISIGSLFLLPFVGMEFLPQEDEGEFRVIVEAPKGSKLSSVDELSLKVEEELMRLPEVQNFTVRMIGESSGMESLILGAGGRSTIEVDLVPKEERDKSTAEVIEEVREKMKEIAGAQINVKMSSSMNMSSGGSGLSVEVYGDDLEKLAEISKELERQIGYIEGTREVSSSFKLKNRQIAIRLDRDKIRQYGLTGTEVAMQIKDAVSGIKATTLKDRGRELDVRIVYPRSDELTMTTFKNVSVRTRTGSYIPLSSLVSVETEEIASDIMRTHQTRLVIISADVYNRDLGSVSRDIESIIDQMKLPDGYSASLGGDTEMMNEAFESLMLVIILAILLVYMVMAAQFESLINPFIIMFTIPLAFTGGWILLFLFRANLTVMSLIGGLVLVGIVVNNGIVLISYIDTLRQRDGYEVHEAVLKACPIRLRPILMTALTTILGQMPMIFSTGQNNETVKSMGLVIAGGLTTSTFLTLLVIPLLYLIFDKLSTRFKRRWKTPERKTFFELEELCRDWDQQDVERLKNEDLSVR